MDFIGTLEHDIQFVTILKSLIIGGIALTFYDYLLMIDDEIKYVWRGRRSFVFYLYISTRTALLALRSWDTYVMCTHWTSESGCYVWYHGVSALTFFLWSSSDIFITLRIYAITFKNKFIAAYLGILALSRLVISLLSAFLQPGTFLVNIPLDIDALNLCPIEPNLQFKVVPYAVAAVFDISAFLIVVWYAYRGIDTLKFSVVIRTIVAEATMYFIAMVAMQIFILLSFVLMTGFDTQFSTAVYGIVNPLLTMRFALSLKRSADSEQPHDLKSSQLGSTIASSGPLSVAPISSVREGIEMGPIQQSARSITDS